MNSFITLSLVLCLAVAIQACCTPSQWEGYQPSMAGYAGRHKRGGIKEFASVHYDADNNRKAIFMTLVNGDKESKFHVVQRYGDDDEEGGKIYVVDLVRDKCWIKKTEKPFRMACIPKGSKVAGSGSLGLETGAGGLKITGYEVKKGDVEALVTVYKINEDVCVPIAETVSGMIKRIGFMKTASFIDITPGIKNATVFDIPKQCEEKLDMSIEAAFERDHFVMAV